MRRTLMALIGCVVLAGCVTMRGPAAGSSAPIRVNLLAINDFHGNLDPPTNGARMFNPANPMNWDTVPAGGAPRLATAVKALSQRPNTIMVAAGDLIGASPLLSSLFHDEPTIEALSTMGLAITSVGNHEFDEGWQELKRMQHGGCHPVDGCRGPRPFEGATFDYLAASTYLDSGEALFPAYTVRAFDGVEVALIGLTLEGTPDLLTLAARAGVVFRDEAETVNALVPEIRAKGIEAIVVLIHEGGVSGAGLDDCHGLSGAIADVVAKFDDAVDVVVAGHTNGIYVCTVDGKLVTSAGSYGTRVTDIALLIDPRTRDVVGKSARDIVITLDGYGEDAEQVALIDAYRALAEPLIKRVVGSVTAAITRVGNGSGESALGGIIADAMLGATQKIDPGVQIAFMNPGGIRSDLPFHDGGRITYGDIFAVQPFGNNLVAMTLTGSEIERVLREQHQASGNNILQVSNGFTFTWRHTPGQPIDIVPGSMRLNGSALVPGQPYRVVTNNFLAGGGDGFSGFMVGTNRAIMGIDIEALEAHFSAHSPVSSGVKGRVTRID